VAVRRRGAAWLAVAALLAAGGALAQKEVVKKFDVKKADDGAKLLVSVDYHDIFDAKSAAKLSSGLPTTVLLRLALRREGEKSPLRMSLRSCKVIYDIWEENYIVTVGTAGKEKTKKLATQAETVKLCAGVKDFPFPVAGAAPGEYRFAAVVDLNPLSQEVLEAMRGWLKRPLGDSGLLGPGDSFFGSFVAIFVNEKIEPSEKMIKLKSQKFKLGGGWN